MTDQQQVYGNYLMPGARVGRYRIEELRGSGGFATVYRAIRDDGAVVAIKALHPYLAATPKVVRRFEIEAQVIRNLDHPNIVKVLEHGALVPGRHCFVMEWIEGSTLAEELRRRGALPAAEVLEVMRLVAPALAAAHAVGVVHRDLKASNVMLLANAPRLDLKLVDFGVAKLLDPEDMPGASGLTSQDTRIGSPENMAPEQIRGETVDARTDVYALGVLLFHLLTNRLPFESENPFELADLHLAAPPPRPSEVAAVPPRFDRVVARCLAKQPADRYPGALDALADLQTGPG